MKIISNFNGEENLIAKTIRETVKPHTIAVAYVGKDWKDYIGPDCLKEIVLSPTAGTNHEAIIGGKDGYGLEQNLGIENIYFVDNLHSKIYIGETYALVGSPNLSKNALGESNLLETAILLSDKHLIEDLKKIVDKYKDISITLYPNQVKKRKQIEALKEANKKNNYLKTKKISFQNYDIEGSGERIIIAWYLSENEAGKIGEDYDIKFPDDLEKTSDKWNNFLVNDKIKKGDRILNWEFNNIKGKIVAKKFSWFVVSDFLDNGVSGQGNYTKLVYQGKNITNFIPPFDVNDVAKKCFNEIINDTQFIDFSGNENEDWHIPSQAQTKKLLKAWQKAVRNATSK